MKNVKNAHMGQHLLLEVYTVPFDKLNDPEKIEKTMVRAVDTSVGAGNTAIEKKRAPFEPELG